MDCTSGKSGFVVECTLIAEAPETDSICFSVTASEKISDGWAAKCFSVTQVNRKEKLTGRQPGDQHVPSSEEPQERYCFD